jgi:hypothetical protein
MSKTRRPELDVRRPREVRDPWTYDHRTDMRTGDVLEHRGKRFQLTEVKKPRR